MTATSCREQIVVAVMAVLDGIAGLPAERNRRTPLKCGENGAAGELPRALLFEDAEQPVDIFTGQDSFDLTLMIQVAVQKSGAEGSTACNDWRAKITQALQTDRTLGGKASDLQITEPGDWIGVDVDSDDAEGFMLALVVRYATIEGDPFTFSNGG